MPRGKSMRRANGTGTVVKLSGRRRRPYEARTAARVDEWGYPRYDVVGRYESRTDALQALALYNNDPYSIGDRSLTFQQVYDRWYKSKFTDSQRAYSQSAIGAARTSFKKCEALYDRVFSELRTLDLQNVVDSNLNFSYSTLQQLVSLFTQLYRYALEYELVSKDYSQFVKVQKDNDAESGIPFTVDEIKLLWNHANDDSKYRDTIVSLLILIYTGWRITEFLTMPLESIDLTAWTMQGGIKTKAGKDRIVPVHSDIQPLLKCLYDNTPGGFLLLSSTGNIKRRDEFSRSMRSALKYCGIESDHTPHDCRHTFISLLDSAGVNQVCIQRLAGHASKSITSKVYTHKDISELRQAVESIVIPH